MPPTSATHPLGILTLRPNPNFRLRPLASPNLNFTVSSGNVWLPPVTAHYPVVEADRQYVSQFAWHEREYKFNPEDRPSRSMALMADGVIRHYQMGLSLPLAEDQDVELTVRAFSLDGGRPPWSLLTSDRFIEWFHSNVAGGEDPFARKHYGFDGAGIHFTDQRGNEIRMQAGELRLDGLDAAYHYYPRWSGLNARGIYLSLTGRMGLSTTRWNPSADLGLQGAVHYRVQPGPRSALSVAFSTGIVSQQLLTVASAVQFSDKPVRGSGALLLRYAVQTTNNRSFSAGAIVTREGSYYRRAGFDYAVLSGSRITTHWAMAIAHLYEPRMAGNLFAAYAAGRISLSVYLREDILAANAPDLQVGTGLQIGL
ncbi:hypothetical protein GGR26_000300 [Lewinella marina]|uniref:hypothetical protein n=1 Tax=Neolewinella marina TaxID=438751 RepID=UPI00117A4E88|nr:hypothetical protein [Neolewinella marina]NJB84555.1 hypothetical protein [Neolewinella marina]